MTLTDERTLIARAQDGDTRAFESLITEHMSQVRRFARAFAREEAEADDLAQEALVKVSRSIRSYRFQSAFSTWMFAIVRNVFLDAIKSRAHRQRGVDAPYESGVHGAVCLEDDGAEAQLSREEERRALWLAIEQIPPEFRTALVMFDIEGLSQDEIAAIERVALGTVKSRVSRGREHLRRILQAQASSRTGNPGVVPVVL